MAGRRRTKRNRWSQNTKAHRRRVVSMGGQCRGIFGVWADPVGRCAGGACRTSTDPPQGGVAPQRSEISVVHY